MTTEFADWDRPYYEPGGGDALALYLLFGDFSLELDLSTEKYRSNGFPDSVEVLAFTRAEHSDYIQSLYAGPLTEILQEEYPDLLPAVDAAPMCLLIKGVIEDPETLEYFRDTIGAIQALMDDGGVAILDSQSITWWSPEDWKGAIFEAEELDVTDHVVIMVSREEGQPNSWVHTRGLRKFGRPDLSVHNVSEEQIDAVADLCTTLADMFARGGVMPDGHEVVMEGLDGTATCTLQGDMDDPDFNNIHVEISLPKS